MSKVALFDMDGTLFDYNRKLLEDYKALMSPGEELPDDIHNSETDYVNARYKLIKSQPGWWRTLPKYQLGWDVYNIASAMGFCIHILTKGPSSQPAAWTEKVQCIQDHFGSSVTVNIVGKTKKHYYGSFLCDDYPAYAFEWLEHRPRGLVIMPAQDYNYGIKHERIIRYDGNNVQQVYDALRHVYDRIPGRDLNLAHN